MKNILLSLATLKAGTGKSTLVKFIIASLNVAPDRVAYACYTGKAAEVLRKKGNDNAMTMHKLLYDSIPRPGGGFFHKPKDRLEYDIVVVDEISMAPKSMLEKLLQHKVYVIMLGDPFQLPQIEKNEAHDFLVHPHIFLDEVMRQAAESEIIQLTMKIRNMEEIPFQVGKEAIIIPSRELVTGHMLWADMIITATNAKKQNINNQMRKLLGYEGLPQDGEKLICRRNYWEDFSEDGKGVLVNGLTGILKNPYESFRKAPNYVKMHNHKMETINGVFISDSGEVFNKVEMDKSFILTGEKCIDQRESYALGKLKNKIGDIVPREFEFGYAISCHRAQGSEFDKVLVLEENFPFSLEEHARWLYTACTRAADKLVLVR